MKEMEARLASDEELATAYAAAHRAYLADRAALGVGRRTGDRGGLRRRDAEPGQVPARAGRPRTGSRTRREPARRRGARCARRLVGSGSLCLRLRRRLRLRHQHDQAADRGAARRRGARDPDRPARPGRRRDRPAGRRGARTGFRGDRRVRRAGGRASRDAGCGSARRRPPATAANADVFAAGVHDRLGVWPEVLSGQEEAALSYDGAVRNLRTPPPSRCSSSTSGAGRPS